MSLSKIYNNYFNPHCQQNKLGEEDLERDMYGVVGIAFLMTAIGAKVFCKANTATVSIMSAAGAGFVASYVTQKRGYASLIGVGFLSAACYSTVDAMRSGRFFVHLDISAIIREIFRGFQSAGRR